MSPREILALFDEERRTLPLSGYQHESTAQIVRSLPPEPGWGWIDWSSHSGGEIDRAIENEIEYFGALGCSFEWKVYDHDQPADLRSRLAARGFQIGPVEAFLVRPVRELSPLVNRTADVRRMNTAEQLEDYLAVEKVTWPADANMARIETRRRFLEHPDESSYYVAYADGKPLACSRITFRVGSKFAGLFGGATIEGYRGRGLYTALVAARAEEALKRGVEFLTVDAWPTSRPILERRGFQCLSQTYPCTWRVAKRDALVAPVG